METVLRIRGMVCGRCIQAVEQALKAVGVTVVKLQLGTVTLAHALSAPQLKQIKHVLEPQGFSLLLDPKVTLVEEVKASVQQLLDRQDLGDHKIRFSDLLEEALQLDYDTISAVFSGVEGTTIEKYIITKRLDKVKEWLVYSDLTLSEIAYRTGFSSVQHLSSQFKQLTGLTPSHFKAVKADRDLLRQKAFQALIS
ncbi:AraC family transcriptional regulator [Larkinella insperata]|uniref:AraC family transcriptional regulator n=1 Tax=Larkinella insperata TaxID=332158 RepID=A0ABW3Q580_9BACT